MKFDFSSPLFAVGLFVETTHLSALPPCAHNGPAFATTNGHVGFPINRRITILRQQLPITASFQLGLRSMQAVPYYLPKPAPTMAKGQRCADARRKNKLHGKRCIGAEIRTQGELGIGNRAQEYVAIVAQGTCGLGWQLCAGGRGKGQK